jgi:iron complex transport system substrate-binding protein
MNRPNRGLVFVIAGVLLAALAACSGEPPQVQGYAGPAGVPAVPAADFPATVKTFYGDVTIEKQPQRVVALGYGDADALVALGVTPIAMTAWEPFGNLGTGPWAEKLMKSRPKLIPSPQMDADYDQIAVVKQLKPDLILETSLNRDPERYQRLAKIAPVISAPQGLQEFSAPTMQQQTLLVAQALGVPWKGQKLVDDLKARVTSVAKQHPEFSGKTISLGQKFETKWTGQILTIDRLQFFLALGFRENPAFVDLANKTKLDPDWIDLSGKDFGAMDADLVVFDATNAGSVEAITKDERFASLPATRDGRSIVLAADPDRPYWQALDRPSVVATNWLLDTLVPEVAGRLD